MRSRARTFVGIGALTVSQNALLFCLLYAVLVIPAGPFGMVATSVIAMPAIDAAAIRFPQRLVGVILGMSLAVVFTAREKGVDEMTEELHWFRRHSFTRLASE